MWDPVFPGASARASPNFPCESCRRIVRAFVVRLPVALVEADVPRKSYSATSEYDVTLPELPPAPEGGLTITVPCTVGGRPPVEHEATMEQDWSLTTPHDLEAERVAAAFGSKVSCLDLAARVVPAVRYLVQARSGRAGFLLKRVRDRSWRVLDHRRGCCWETFDDPAEAARHARSASHAARRHGTSAQLVEDLAERVIAAHGGPAAFAPDLSQADDWVVPAGGLLELWAQGISSETVERIWRRGIRRPATVRYYLGVVAMKPDLEWIRATADVNPDDLELPAHLAWTETPADRADPTARAAWLRIGAPRELSRTLAEYGVAPEQVREFAGVVGQTPSAAAARLCAWVRAVGSVPSLAALATLYAAGVPGHYELSPTAAARLERLLAAEGYDLCPQDVAMMLAAAGSVPGALAWVRAGECDPVAVAQKVATGADVRSRAGLSEATR